MDTVDLEERKYQFLLACYQTESEEKTTQIYSYYAAVIALIITASQVHLNNPLADISLILIVGLFLFLWLHSIMKSNTENLKEKRDAIYDEFIKKYEVFDDRKNSDQ